jgi:hypothetical protein
LEAAGERETSVGLRWAIVARVVAGTVATDLQGNGSYWVTTGVREHCFTRTGTKGLILGVDSAFDFVAIGVGNETFDCEILKCKFLFSGHRIFPPKFWFTDYVMIRKK